MNDSCEEFDFSSNVPLHAKLNFSILHGMYIKKYTDYIKSMVSILKIYRLYKELLETIRNNLNRWGVLKLHHRFDLIRDFSTKLNFSTYRCVNIINMALIL